MNWCCSTDDVVAKIKMKKDQKLKKNVCYVFDMRYEDE